MSSEARWQLFFNSLFVSAKYPIFGVDMGNSSWLTTMPRRKKGIRRSSWHVTHNMYTHVSSECRVPGALLFIAIIIYTPRRVEFVRNKVAAIHPQPRELELRQSGGNPG